MYINVYLCVAVCIRVQVPAQARRGCLIAWSWSYRLLQAY